MIVRATRLDWMYLNSFLESYKGDSGFLADFSLQELTPPRRQDEKRQHETTQLAELEYFVPLLQSTAHKYIVTFRDLNLTKSASDWNVPIPNRNTQAYHLRAETTTCLSLHYYLQPQG